MTELELVKLASCYIDPGYIRFTAWDSLVWTNFYVGSDGVKPILMNFL
jgi:hypothetical protein